METAGVCCVTFQNILQSDEDSLFTECAYFPNRTHLTAAPHTQSLWKIESFWLFILLKFMSLHRSLANLHDNQGRLSSRLSFPFFL